METVVGALAALVLVAGPVAVGVTKVVDFARNLFDSSDTAPKWAWNALAFVLGIGVAFGWQVNLLEAVVAAIPALADKAGTQDFIGQLLTGVIIGGMAGFWHEKLDQWSSWAKSRAG